MTETKSHTRRARSTTIGWILWRGGLYFSSTYIGWEGTVRMWRFLIEMRVPTQLIVAIILAMLGTIIVLITLIVERLQDAKTEKGLRDE